MVACCTIISIKINRYNNANCTLNRLIPFRYPGIYMLYAWSSYEKAETPIIIFYFCLFQDRKTDVNTVNNVSVSLPICPKC